MFRRTNAIVDQWLVGDVAGSVQVHQIVKAACAVIRIFSSSVKLARKPVDIRGRTDVAMMSHESKICGGNAGE